nr:MAG TPA: hypothetical protein [Caudoviricetes sp.]
MEDPYTPFPRITYGSLTTYRGGDLYRGFDCIAVHTRHNRYSNNARNYRENVPE